MKIGILTFHDTANFGAALQAYSTYAVLKKIGADAEIINYRCESIDRRELPRKAYSFRNGTFKRFAAFLLTLPKTQKKYSSLHKFMYSNTVITKRKYNKHNISNINDLYDRFLVGSDMLWCTDFTESDMTYMLNFVPQKNKKFAFGTSIGHDWQYDEIPVIKNLLQEFNTIALREKESAVYVSKLTEKDVKYVCDPTMLISPAEWREFIRSDINESDFVFMYMGDSEKKCENAARKFCKEKKLEFRMAGFRIPLSKSEKSSEILELFSINDFLSAIANSSSLFTASYHGMLFAIYFHVPFVYFNKDSLRLENIAMQFGVENRNGDKFDFLSMPEIDWDAVDKRRKEFASRSLGILRSMVVE